jgi:hypothetical protein
MSMASTVLVAPATNDGVSRLFVVVVLAIRQSRWLFAFLSAHDAFTAVTMAMMMPSMRPLSMALEGDEMVLMVMMVNGWTCVWWIEIRGMA